MAEEAAPAKRQFVNFCFLKVDPAWRRLPQEERQAVSKSLSEPLKNSVVKSFWCPIPRSAFAATVIFVLWRITYELELFQEQMTKALATGLGQYLTTPYSYLSMTKRSVYVDHTCMKVRRAPLEDYSRTEQIHFHLSL